MSAGHDHHHHHHVPSGEGSRRRLWLVLILTSLYMGAEVIGGLLSGSLALLADAGHMLSDTAALALALIATSIAQRPPSPSKTFGYQRAEVLGALANGATLLAVSFYIFIEAFERFSEPPAVQSGVMMAVAVGGLLVNLTALWILQGGRKDNLNVRGAWLHVLGDALGSVGAIGAALLIRLFGWNWADPAASLLIGVLVVYSSWGLLRETTAVLMQGVPNGIDIGKVVAALASIDGVEEVHDLHVWSITSGRNVASCHLVVDDRRNAHEVLEAANELLAERFQLNHTTIQVEDADHNCAPCEPPKVDDAHPA